MRRAVGLIALVLALASAIVLPTLALAVSSYQTPKGGRTSVELHDELAIAGYGGPWDIDSMLAAYTRATAPPLGPAYQNVLPNSCVWDSLAVRTVYFCTYPSGDFAAWQDASSSSVLIAFTPPGGTPTFTDAGARILDIGQVVAPPTTPLIPRAPQPSDSDLVVRILSVEAYSRSFPTVQGQVCNNAQGWFAQDISIQFDFYFDSLMPTLDSGRKSVYSVNPGDCQRFNSSLNALQPWRSIAIRRVTSTWSPS